MQYRCVIALFTLGALAGLVAGAQTPDAAPPRVAAAQQVPPEPQPASIPPPAIPVTDAAGMPPTAAMPARAPLPPPSEQLADTLSARGRYLLAIQTLEQLPPTATIWNKLGVACLHMLMFDRARANFETAIKLNPRYPEAYNNLGTLLHSQGDLGHAEKMYKKALRLRPNSPSTLKNLGTLYYAERKFKKGDGAYQEALRMDPQVLERSTGHDIQTSAKGQNAGETHYHMALSYAQAGSYPTALEYLRKAIGEGFHDRNRLLHEKGFADLRLQPVFLQMVDDLKKE